MTKGAINIGVQDFMWTDSVELYPSPVVLENSEG